MFLRHCPISWYQLLKVQVKVYSDKPNQLNSTSSVQGRRSPMKRQEDRASNYKGNIISFKTVFDSLSLMDLSHRKLAYLSDNH